MYRADTQAADMGVAEVTDLPGKCYAPCSHCGKQMQIYPIDRALMVWCSGQTICAGCAAGPDDDDRGEEED